jgi:hypothetical protein
VSMGLKKLASGRTIRNPPSSGRNGEPRHFAHNAPVRLARVHFTEEYPSQYHAVPVEVLNSHRPAVAIFLWIHWLN